MSMDLKGQPPSGSAVRKQGFGAFRDGPPSRNRSRHVSNRVAPRQPLLRDSAYEPYELALSAPIFSESGDCQHENALSRTCAQLSELKAEMTWPSLESSPEAGTFWK